MVAPSDGFDKRVSVYVPRPNLPARPLPFRGHAVHFDLKQARPELERKQREGRALLWDKPIDRDLQADLHAGDVAQKPYVYQTAPSL